MKRLGVSGPFFGAILLLNIATLVVFETEKEVRVVVASDILFDFDQAVIRPDAASD
jgi:hypothetical protein